MESSRKMLMLGKDHEARGEIYFQGLDSANIALGTSPGVTSKPNEDAAGVSIFDSDIILALADGHWGREASEIAVTKAMKLLGSQVRPTRESETRAHLFSLFEQVNDQLYEMATSAPDALTPETTLIVCHIREADGEKYLDWSSFGDSYLFLWRDRKLKQLNTLHPRWLGYLSRLSEKADRRAILMRFLTDGARYVGVASGLETGVERLQEGDIILLCSDGLVGSDQEPDPMILDSLSGLLGLELSPASIAEKLISFALDRQEKDNVSCALTVIS